MASFIIIVVAGCTASQPLHPRLAQQMLTDSWQAHQHVIWELDWPAAPVGGSLTVETWRAGDRYRFEILEAPAAALVGEVLVFDGQEAWRYNRFNPPLFFTPTPSSLSPVSDAFAIIDHLINASPQTATLETVQINFNPSQKITAVVSNGDHLILWRDLETGLPVRIVFFRDGRQATLNAREFEPLLDLPEELFGVGDWINGIP